MAVWVRLVRYFNFPPHHPSGLCRDGFACHDPLRAWTGTTNGRLRLPSCVTPSLVAVPRWYRNVHRFPIAYAVRPRLRSRLTLSGRAFLRNPWACGAEDSHPGFRYSYRHSHFPAVHTSFQSCFCQQGTLPYQPPRTRDDSVASVTGLSPVDFRRRTARPVSCYALFK